MSRKGWMGQKSGEKGVDYPIKGSEVRSILNARSKNCYSGDNERETSPSLLTVLFSMNNSVPVGAE